MVTPQAKGLFHGAVAQSAVRMNLARLHDSTAGQETAEEAGQKLMVACGLNASADVRQMRGLDVNSLLKAAPNEPGPDAALRLKPLVLRLGPVVDGRVIPDNPDLLFASGRQHPVPMIVGNTKDEMTLLLLMSKMPADEAAYLQKLKDEFGDSAELIAKAYPAQDPKQVRSAVIQLTSDLSFVSESRHIARANAAAGQPTFRYQFSRGTKRGFLQSLGAHHGAELAFLFQRPSTGNDEGEMRISRTMGRYWINFAATGNPNGPGLPTWPAYHSNTEDMLDFAEEVQVLKGHRNDQLDVIEKVSRKADQ